MGEEAHAFPFLPGNLLVSNPLSLGFLGGSVVKNSPANAGDLGLIPGSGRSPGEGNSNPLQYSRLKNPMDRGTWQAAIHGVAKSWIPATKQQKTILPCPSLHGQIYCLCQHATQVTGEKKVCAVYMKSKGFHGSVPLNSFKNLTSFLFVNQVDFCICGGPP